MSPTVDALRNEIRVSVGRYERTASTAFTKEALAAICDAVGRDVGDSLPSKPEMRAAIATNVDALEDRSPDEAERPFRKDELAAIAEELRDE